jgi:hypothetical protein
MAINLDAIRNRLSGLKNSSNRTTNIWKPEPGEHQIRIVPYVHNRENPFIELHFHYNLGKKSMLSPSSFGRPDPVLEFAKKLQQAGDKESWIAGKKMEPKMRTYVPVIIRGQENEGVKFWGFGKQIYQELLSFIADPDYGDITDPTMGRDVVVEYIPQEKSDTNFAKTSVKIKPNQTPVVGDVDLAKKLQEEQPDIMTMYKEPSYEELRVVLEKYLDPEMTDPVAKGTPEVKSVSVTTLDVRTEISESSVVKNALDEFDKLFDN